MQIFKIRLLLIKVSIVSLLASMLFADPFSPDEVAKTILEKAKEYKINPSVLYTLASIESDFEPLSLSVVTSAKGAKYLSSIKKLGIKTAYSSRSKSFHSKKSLICFYPKDAKTASYILKLLMEHGFVVDVGLMQIDTVNFSIEEAEEILYPENNIDYAAQVYAECSKLFNGTKLRTECYNRGAGNLKKALKRGERWFPYWQRFKRHYNRYFEGKI